MKSKRLFKLVLGIALAALLVPLIVSCAAPAPAPAPKPAPAPAELPSVSWVLQTSETSLTGNPFSAELVETLRRITARTGGKFTIRQLIAKEIGIDRDEFPTALAKGTIDLAWLYTPVMSGIYSFLGVFDLPYLTTDQYTVFKAYETLKPMIDEAIKGSGYTVVPPGIFHAWLPQDLLSRDRIANLADLKGLKVRIWRALDAELIKALGGEPVYMPIAEVYTAMQRGVVQALNTGPQAMVENSLFEAGKNYYAVRLEPGGAWTCVNDKKWEALPNEYKTVLMEEMVAGMKKIQGWYDKEADKWKLLLVVKGVTVNEPTKAEMDVWRSKGRVIWDSWAAKAPKNKQALDLVTKALGY